MAAPVPESRPHTVLFGKVEGQNRGPNPMDPPKERQDDLFWLRDDARKDEKVIAHLELENAHTDAKTAHLKAFNEGLYDEMKGYLKETDDTHPYPRGPFLWFERTVEGLSYKVHCRKPKEGGEPDVVLDVNEVAKELKYCSVGSVVPSPSSFDLLAYSVDSSGNELYTIYIKRLSTNTIVDKIEGTSSSICWSKDERSVYYLKKDHTLRPYQLYRRTLPDPANPAPPDAHDECLLTELDERFWMGMYVTLSGRFLVVELDSTETSEVHLIDFESDAQALSLVQARVQGCLYSVAHCGDALFVVTNRDKAKNFKLMSTPLSQCSGEHWSDVEAFPYSPDRKLDSVVCFANHLVLSGREGGFTQLWVCALTHEGGTTRLGDTHRIQFEEEVFTARKELNKEFDTALLRINYTSLTTPPTSLHYDMDKRVTTVLKVQEVPGYQREGFQAVRLEATASDGTRVPISMVFAKKGEGKVAEYGKGPRPMLLYGYGSYGHSIDPYFDFKRQVLLDRGVVFAIAHIRGGGEMGRYWYEDEGKYLTKKNTFTDFVDCAQHLVNEGLTESSMLGIEGRSAGGLLMGAVLNLAPSLFSFALAGVPFVDVMVTMCDASIPLTVVEWEEWGNPNEAKFHDYMLSYSPMENVSAQPYPTVLITAGLHDPRVAYWEPAKWAARLRRASTSGNAVLLKIDLAAGHFSASDRYKYIRERAFEYGVFLDHLGLAEPKGKL